MIKTHLLILLFFVNTGFSQGFKTLLGKEYSTSKKENFSGFLGENATTVFTADYVYYSKRKQELFIRKFHRSDLQLTDSQNIYRTLDEGYTNDPKEIFFIGDKFYLFSKMYSERDQTQLIALEVFDESVNRINFQVIDSIKVDEIEYVELAEDKSGFLIAKHQKYTQLMEQEILFTQVDLSGDVTLKKKIKSPMALQNLRIENIQFKKNTPIYFLCNYAFDLMGGEDRDQGQMVNNKYALWSYDIQKSFLKEFEVRLKKKWINGIEMGFNANDQLILAGFFNETKNETVSGVFNLIISPQLSLLHTAWERYDDKLFQTFKRRDKNKKVTEIPDVKMKELLILNDGSFMQIGEQYYKYIERNYDPRTNITTTTEHFNYNSIVVSYFDKIGKHKWTRHIPKFQNTTNDFGYFSSFVAYNTGKEVHLLFNDTEKNLDVELGDYGGYTSIFNNRKFVITYVSLDKTGVVARDRLFPEQNSFMLRAKMSGQINSASLYLITETNRNSRLIKID